jgi:hypothetical protein
VAGNLATRHLYGGCFTSSVPVLRQTEGRRAVAMDDLRKLGGAPERAIAMRETQQRRPILAPRGDVPMGDARDLLACALR